MAKKRSGPNASEAIRTYLKDHPGTKPKAAAAEISTQLGKKVTPAFVSQVKNKMKKSKGGRPKGRKAAAAGSAANGSLDLLTIEATKELVRRIGADNLKRLIEVLAR